MCVRRPFDPAVGFLMLFLKNRGINICLPFKEEGVLENIFEELKRK